MKNSNLAEVLFYRTGLQEIPVFESKHVIPFYGGNDSGGIIRTIDKKTKSEKTPCGDNRKKAIPIWEKTTLTLSEAAEYTNIGIHKLRELTDEKNCDFVLWNGNKRLIKRRLLEEFLEKVYSI